MLPRSNVAKMMIVYFCTRFHLYIHAYALVLIGRGLSLLEISTIETVVIATLFLAEVPTGVLADRVGRRGSIVLSTLFLMLGELIFAFSSQYWQYLIIAVFTGLGFAFSSGAAESLIYDSLPPENRDASMKRTMGRYNSVGQIAFFLAPLVGGVVLGDLAPGRVQAAILLTVLALGIGVLVSLTLREPVTEWHAERSLARQIFVGGMSEIRRSPLLQKLVLVILFTAPFGGTFVTTLAGPYMAQNGVPPYWIALALSFGSLIAAFAQANVHRIERLLGERWALVVLILLPGMNYLLLASLVGALPVWLLITVMYGTNDWKAPLLSAYQNALITSRSRATVLSMISMIVNVFVAVVAPIYAALATRSLPLAFAVMGSVIIGASLLLRIDRLPFVAGTKMPAPQSE
jgi:predicted MFS family arabinose efflux permease